MNKPKEFWIAQGSHADIVCQSEQHAKDLGWAKPYIHTIEKSAYDYYKDHAEMFKAELDKANKKLLWYESGNIHTCNYQCERPLCVQRRKIDKLKNLLLLTDQSVQNVEMNKISMMQWSEFVKTFPDEGEENK